MEDNSTTTQPQQQMDLLAKARTMTAFKVAMALDMYYLPVVLVIGVFANIISFIVMLMKHNRGISCCVYIAYLALCDLGMTCVAGYFYLQYTVRVGGGSSGVAGCKLSMWSAGFFTVTSCYFVVAMTVDRYVAICHPHRLQGLRTPRTAVKLGAGLMAAVAVYATPYLYTANLSNGYCTGVTVVSKLSSFYSMLNVVLGSVVPFSVLIVLNGFIARAVWKRNKKVAAQSNAGTSDTNQNTGTKKGEKQLIAMLFLVSGALFVLTLPIYARHFLSTTIDYKSSAATYANFMLLQHCANKMLATNHAINFFLYILGGKGFRKDVLKLFGRSTGAGGAHGGTTQNTTTAGTRSTTV